MCALVALNVSGADVRRGQLLAESGSRARPALAEQPELFHQLLPIAMQRVHFGAGRQPG